MVICGRPNAYELIDCKCEGRNPECQICEGRGYYYKLPDTKNPKLRIENPVDPFPLIIKNPVEQTGVENHIKRWLEKYKIQLESKRKKREMSRSLKRKH